MYEKVSSVGKIGLVELKNRFIMPAMGSHHGEEDGSVGDELIAYYAARAKGGFGLLITEFTTISPEGKALPGQLANYSDDCVPGFKRLTAAIHTQGSKIFMQLQHSGRQTTSHFTGLQPVAPSPVPCPVNMELPRELTVAEIQEIVEKLGDGALRAQTAGFDGVEIHGAHGYLPAQFMSSYSNKRIDEYGGNLMGKVRFSVELIQNIKQKCGQEFPIIFRISGDERVESGRKLDETVLIAKLLEEAGADAIHVSTGVYASMQYMVAPANVPQGFNLDAAQAVKQAVHIPVIAVGRITDPLMAEDVIASGIADFVALGRACLADPEFPNKVKAGRADEISPCVGCLTRCNGAPGIDPNDHGVSCMINPFTGHERFMQIDKAEKPKRIVIVGGGMGGLETAWVSAARGHQVTLFEKNEKVGGQVIPGSVPPFKHELTRAIRFYTTMCQKYGVDMRLGTEADTQAILDLKPDEVILATGAIPTAPSIPNDGIPVVQAVDVLNGQIMLGKRVLIVGGGLVGLETAEYLLTQNRQVTIVEMLDQAGAGLHPSIQFFVFRALKAGSVDILTNAKVEKFLVDGAICSNDSGELRLSGYDMVILAVGSKAYNPLQAALTGKVPSLHVIGDADQPRRIVDAIEEGARLAVKL